MTELQTNNDMRDLSRSIMELEPHLAAILPKGTIDPSRIVRLVLSQVKKNPKLAYCDRLSVLGCIARAVQTGVEPELAYLIPFGKQCNLIFDYKALMELARRHPDVNDVYAAVVKSKDEFSYYENDAGVTFLHRTDPFGDRGDVIGYYAIARLKNGGCRVYPMSVDQVEESRQQNSLSKNSDAWKKHFDEMAMKTCIRRLCKTLPKSTELAQALAVDDSAYEIEQNNHLLIDPKHEPEYQTSKDGTTIAEVNAEGEQRQRDQQRDDLVNAIVDRASQLRDDHGATQGDIEERMGCKFNELGKKDVDTLAAILEVLS